MIGVWLWIAVLVLFNIHWSPGVSVQVGDGDDGPVGTRLPFQPRRPPIPLEVIPDCYFILSDIRLKMSFLHLFKHLWELETLAAERLRVLCSNLDLEWMVVAVSLCALIALCLLFRKPPDRLFEWNGFIIEVKSPRRWIVRYLLRLFGLLSLLIGVFSFAAKCSAKPRPQDNQALQECIATLSDQDEDLHGPLFGLSAAFYAEQYETSSPREMGGWDSDAFPIVLDSGTSKSITPVFSDLHNPRPFESDLQGVGTGRITHVGAIRYEVLDDNGQTVTLEDQECYYCTDAPYRLFCPHSWKRQLTARAGSEGADVTFMTDPSSNSAYLLTWNSGKISVTVPLDTRLNLPILYGKSSYVGFQAFAGGFSSFPVMLDDGDTTYMPEDMPMHMPVSKQPVDNARATARHVHFAHDVPQAHGPRKIYPREHAATPKPSSTSPTRPSSSDDDLFLSWHIKLGHAPFQNVRWAATQGILPKRLANCTNVVCPACLYGKQKRRPWRYKGKPTPNPIKRATCPGQFVSCDQLISGTPGLMGQSSGNLTRRRYYVATIFVDHFSDLDYVHLQESTSALETIEAKHAFERFARDRGVTIRHYHCDNGVFASRGFREEIQRCGQTISFCGVGAHHQNGVAERRIQDLSDSARAMLAHASHRNPAITAHLWPYALRHASYIRRLLPRKGHSQSPEEFFSAVPVRPTTRYLHAFGCPVYVLQEALQSGKKQPKWGERSRVGVYLGHSAQHAPTVSLILNPMTGLISPQFHCVFDDQFNSPKLDHHFSTFWAEKAGLLESKSGSIDSEAPEGVAHDYLHTPIPAPMAVPYTVEEVREEQERMGEQGRQLDAVPRPQHEDDERLGFDDDFPNDEEREPGGVEEPAEPEGAARTTRSGRRIKLTQRLAESELLPKLRSFVAILCHVTAFLGQLDDNSLNELCQYVAFPASLADEDTMYLSEAMRQKDKAQFLEAMIKEITDHTSRGHWRITTKDEMRQRGYQHKPIMAIWSFKRKRNPFGEITKYKARLCCHGGQTIKGVHYEETFSPVVAWSTVRLMLTLSEVYGWHARQIDFVLAFPQADVKADIYMHVPEKFRVDKGKLVLDEQAPHPSKQNNVVKLIKNIYGLADASLTWHTHLKKGLLDYGFKQSQVDPCLFMKGNLLFILYVDDGVVLCPNKRDADDLINNLKAKGYILTDEGSLAAYLGIQVERLSHNRISMKQPAFIDRIINQCGLKDQRMHDTPADTILHRDENGPARKTDFHMRSIIGQLNYLASTTRPEIQFAVHQCARFVSDPKMSHEKAVKRIIRYLKRTRDKGIIMQVDKSKGIECFVDADFAGGYQKENTSNPRDCLSRTGYIIKYAGCPIVWSSKLQTTIALSTTEAEYMALSMACREVIYLINLTDELREEGVNLISAQPEITCQVFEDNAGAIELAKLPKLRPRTKHLAIQYHHFRSWTVKGLDGEEPRIKMNYISTAIQEADIMTKPLAKPQFETLRKRLCGW